MDSLEMPALFFAGNRDLIAPPAGCRMIVDALGSSKKECRVCGSGTGFSEDFTHARLIASQGAQREIWPLIREFLHENGEPAVTGDGRSAAGSPRLPETV